MMVKRFFSSILQNPVIAKELRNRMRGRRAFIGMILYLGLISLLLVLIYWSMLSGSSSQRWSPGFQQTVGKAVFGVVGIVELLLIGLTAPSLTASAIASERERQTLELLRTTLLSPAELVLGKFGAAISFLMLLIVAALPIQSLAFFLGGVGFPEMSISWLMLFVTTIAFSAMGMFCSSVNKSTAAATSWAYGLIVLGLVLPLIVTFFLATSSFYNLSSRPFPVQWFVMTWVWFIISTNPIGAAVTSEVILTSNNSLYYMSTTMGSNSIHVPSPWIIYTLFYTALTVLFLYGSIRAVRNSES